MRFVTHLTVLFTALLLVAATGSAVAFAKLRSADAQEDAAYLRANEIVEDAERVSGAARDQVNLLLGYMRGAATRADIEQRRAEFAEALEAARPEGVQGGADAVESYLDNFSALEASLFVVATPRGAVSLWDLVDAQRAAADDVARRSAGTAEALAVLPDGAAARAIHADARASLLEYAPTLSNDVTGAQLLQESYQARMAAAQRALLAIAADRIEGVASAQDIAAQLASPAASVEPASLERWRLVASAEPALAPALEPLALAVDLAATRARAETYFNASESLQRHVGELLGSRTTAIDLLADATVALARDEAAAQLALAEEKQQEADGVKIAALLLTGVPVGIGGVIASRKLRRRLHDFDEASAAVAAGRFDAPPALRGDELDRLADTWTQMLGALDQRERERKQRTEELLQNERMAALGSLLAGVAHEINNPLAFIKANEEMSAQDVDSVLTDPSSTLSDVSRATLEAVRGSLHTNVDGIARVEKLNRALKGFGGPSRAAREPVDLNDVVEGVLIIAHNRLKNRYKIARLLQPVPKVNASAQELGQVVLNLLINAAEASPVGGTIHIQTASGPGGVTFRVRDEGPGIAPEFRARLFERHATTKGHGTGLGLYISRTIATDHGGTLELEPTPKGASFVMTLPGPTLPRPIPITPSVHV